MSGFAYYSFFLYLYIAEMFVLFLVVCIYNIIRIFFIYLDIKKRQGQPLAFN